MLTSLITLPVRVGLRGAELGVRVSQAVAEKAIAAVGAVLAPTASPEETETASPARASDRERAPAAPPERAPAAPPERAPAAPPPPPAPPVPRPAPPVPRPAEPEHISEDSTLVRETSDPGAVDGAGAQVRVAEPWEGYRELKAADVIDRVRGRDKAELAAVELYELSHRGRRTVLDAVKRELRRAQNAP